MNFLIIQTQESQGVYYNNGIFHRFKIQEGQYMTPFKNNGGGISPAAKAVNDTLLCTKPSVNPEHCNFPQLKLLSRLKIQCFRRRRLFLVHNWQYVPSKRNDIFWGYLLMISIHFVTIVPVQSLGKSPGTREKLFGGFPKEKKVGGHY